MTSNFQLKDVGTFIVKLLNNALQSQTSAVHLHLGRDGGAQLAFVEVVNNVKYIDVFSIALKISS